MEVEQAVNRMRVIRHFRLESLAESDLHAILEAGRHTGSSKNLQHWHFIVVRERDQLRALAGVGEFAGHLAEGGTAIALVTPDPRAPGAPLSLIWDAGRAAQNMMLVAWSRGIGSVPATVYDQSLCRHLLGYPEEQHCEHILNFGYPASESSLVRAPRAGGRVALDEIASFERWGAHTR